MYRLLKPVLLAIRELSLKFESRFDHKYVPPDVSRPQRVAHVDWRSYLGEIANRPGFRILELGSREVTDPSDARRRFANASYTGFDYFPGRNVDVVGDAHKLSSYFKSDQKFDLVYSSASFEHFAMPWVVAEEISKVLAVGGLVFVETHFSFSSHERPWHFFQFSDMALRALFSEALGFECLDAGMCNPIVGRFSSLADDHLKNRPVRGLFCHSEYLGRKTRDVEHFDWRTVDIRQVVGGTVYPRGVPSGAPGR
jgi:hypothetical protein